MKGNEIPFVGVKPVTTHILNNACMIIIISAPVAKENSYMFGTDFLFTQCHKGRALRDNIVKVNRGQRIQLISNL